MVIATVMFEGSKIQGQLNSTDNGCIEFRLMTPIVVLL
jgi:hypothetical protein